MRMLECPGVFTMPVPDGWRALGTPGVCYELLPPRGAGAIHVTVFPRHPAVPRPHEARALLSTFIGQIRPTDPLVVINERAEGPVQRACARFPGAHENGLPAYWFAGTVLAPGRFLLCSSTTPPNDPLLDFAERMFARLTLIPPHASRQQQRPRPSLAYQ